MLPLLLACVWLLSAFWVVWTPLWQIDHGLPALACPSSPTGVPSPIKQTTANTKPGSSRVTSSTVTSGLSTSAPSLDSTATADATPIYASTAVRSASSSSVRLAASTSMLAIGSDDSSALGSSVIGLTSTSPNESPKIPSAGNSAGPVRSSPVIGHHNNVALSVSLSLVLLLILAVAIIVLRRKLARRRTAGRDLQPIADQPFWRPRASRQDHGSDSMELADVANLEGGTVLDPSETLYPRKELETPTWSGPSDFFNVSAVFPSDTYDVSVLSSPRTDISSTGACNRCSTPSSSVGGRAYATGRSAETLPGGTSIPALCGSTKPIPIPPSQAAFAEQLAGASGSTDSAPHSSHTPLSSSTARGLWRSSVQLTLASQSLIGSGTQAIPVGPASLGATIQLGYTQILGEPASHDSFSEVDEPRIVVNLPLSIGHRLMEISGTGSSLHTRDNLGMSGVQIFDVPPPYDA
ncbi:hypothetical protein ONZ51_g9171 [Trametes cubensis]|uniref:Uncharacterized protein n=1 Tax=Trametes cubensis TaxID=1111947 RepID=A0AAD7TLV7_9APHY|nr:hypothetical protein ONZ51_g9171 [Trametes cubensis]